MFYSEGDAHGHQNAAPKYRVVVGASRSLLRVGRRRVGAVERLADGVLDRHFRHHRRRVGRLRRRAVDAAEREDAAAILLVINTFGGRVDSATDIRDALMRSSVPVIAYVPERAWSAGALIALAADHIAMEPGASIGAAEPQPAEEKTISALRAEFEATAEAHGRDPRVAAAMVDRRVAVEGVSPEGQILTLSALRANELGFIDLLVNSREEVLAHFDLAGAQLQETEPNWANRSRAFCLSRRSARCC